MLTTDKNGSIVVSALRARANFGKLLRRVEGERRSLVIEKRGTPKAVLLSIREAVPLTSDRNGTSGIFKQGISQETAEPVVTGPQGASNPRLSADGTWILYQEQPKTAGPSTPVALLRIPVSGGVPQHVLAMRNDSNYGCARAPANLCVVSEVSQGERQFTLTAFDPLKGRGKVLKTIQKGPTTNFDGTALSPDGTTFAISKGGEAEIHIHLLSLSGGTDSEITVKDWPNLTGLDWSPDGKGLYSGSVSPQARTLLYCAPEGKCPRPVAVQGTMGSNLGRTFTGRPLPRHTRRRRQQQRVDAGRVLRTVTSDE